VPYLSALEVRSRQGAIQIHVYLYLYLWGTNNVLVPQLLGRSFQKARNFTARELTNKHTSHQNAGFSIWILKNFPGVIPLDPNSGRGQPSPAPNTAGRASAPLLSPKPWSPQLFSRGCAPPSLN